MDTSPPQFGWTDTEPHNHHRMLLRAVLPMLPRPPATLLDFGCGNGWLSEQYRLAGYTVTGADRSDDGLKLAAKAFPLVTFRRIEVGADLGGPFDCIVSTEVIEHLYSPATMLARCFDALRPGGVMVISTPYHGWLKNVLIAATGRFDSHVDPAFEGGHIKFFSRSTLAAMLHKAGFEQVAFRGAGRAPFLWKSMILSVCKP